MSDIRVDTEPDFILSKKFGYSMQRLIERYPDGAPDEVIAQALGITPAEVEKEYQAIVLKIREDLQEDEPYESILP